MEPPLYVPRSTRPQLNLSINTSRKNSQGQNPRPSYPNTSYPRQMPGNPPSYTNPQPFQGPPAPNYPPQGGYQLGGPPQGGYQQGGWPQQGVYQRPGGYQQGSWPQQGGSQQPGYPPPYGSQAAPYNSPAYDNNYHNHRPPPPQPNPVDKDLKDLLDFAENSPPQTDLHPYPIVRRQALLKFFAEKGAEAPGHYFNHMAMKGILHLQPDHDWVIVDRERWKQEIRDGPLLG